MGFLEKIFGSKDREPDKQSAPPQNQPLEEALPTRMRSTPKLPESSIAASFALEPLPVGSQATVAATGEVRKGKSEGALLTREGFTKWTITNTSTEPIQVLSPAWHIGSKEEPRIVQPGQSTSGVPSYSEVLVGPMRVHLPGLGFAREKALEYRGEQVQGVPGLEKKSAELNQNFKQFFHAIEALRRNDFSGAQNAFTAILSKLDFDVNRDECVFMVFSYQRAVFDLKGIVERTQKKGDLIIAPTLITPVEDDSAEELQTLGRRVEREATITLAILCAKELRQKLGGPLSHAVKSHPKAGSITPETDAILLLHSLGVSLSPLFFRLSPGRDEAFKMILAMNKGNSGGDLAVAS